MSQIDPTRLSRILTSLSRPQEGGRATATQKKDHSPPNSAHKGEKSPAILRARLQERLVKLKKDQGELHKAAPLITVQEILRWEFGESILDHPEFERVVTRVAESMLEDRQLEAAIYRVIDTLIMADNS